MKKFMAFSLIILYFVIICIFLTEKTDALSFKTTPWNIRITNDSLLTWQKLPYPSLYEVDTFIKNPNNPAIKEKYKLVKKHFTFNNTYAIAPILPTYYQIKAYGMFGRIGQSSSFKGDTIFTGKPLIPTPITIYNKNNPASLRPYLIWHTVPNAVYYQLELLSGPSDDPHGIKLSQTNHLYSSENIFTHGCQVDLSPYEKEKHIFWRIRALDFHGNPIGVFSTLQKIIINPAVPVPQKPLLDNYDTIPGRKMPLYPVYNWIPMLNTTHYEVELLKQTPTSLITIETLKVTDLFSCYDKKPLMKKGTYYWRVRGIDAKGTALGEWSDLQKINYTAPTAGGVTIATFGDSITHGGGNISYSPANMEYNYQTYLDFPTINLAKSGDTSRMALDRFDHDVLPFAPRNLLILCGTNSLRDENISADTIIAELQKIRQKCLDNNIHPVFMTLLPLNPANIKSVFNTNTDPDWKNKLKKVNDYILSLPCHIDIEPYFLDENGNMAEKYSPDGLHPNIAGKKIMAAIINRNKNLFIWSDPNN